MTCYLESRGFGLSRRGVSRQEYEVGILLFSNQWAKLNTNLYLGITYQTTYMRDLCLYATYSTAPSTLSEGAQSQDSAPSRALLGAVSHDFFPGHSGGAWCRYRGTLSLAYPITLCVRNKMPSQGQVSCSVTHAAIHEPLRAAIKTHRFLTIDAAT